MTLFEDTRQKKDCHENIKKQCNTLKIKLISKKLDVADYQLKGVDNVLIDTKQNLYELASNLFGKNEVVRFQKMCKRAKQNNIKLYILTEQPMTKEKLLKWTSRKKRDGTLITKITGKQIYNKMQIYSLAFGVKWRFCRKADTVKTMLKLFNQKDK